MIGFRISVTVTQRDGRTFNLRVYMGCYDQSCVAKDTDVRQVSPRSMVPGPTRFTIVK